MVAASGIPYKFTQPWGGSAPAGAVTDPIPATTGSAAAASQALGFPIGTATPVPAGGTPPNYADFNGGLFYATSWARWQQAGGPVGYDAAFSANIGGYPKGAMIAAAAPTGKMWLSTSDNNASDPDTGGGGWVSATSGRFLGFQTFAASGIYNPSSALVWFIVVEGVGGGGAGGGTVATTTGQCSASAGGNAGSYARAVITSGFSGATVTLGAGGIAASGAAGGNGGTTSFGSLLTIPGGTGGVVGNALEPFLFSNPATVAGAPPSTTGQMIVATPGAYGGGGILLGVSAAQQLGGNGASSPFGLAGLTGLAAGYGYGAGGGGNQAAQNVGAQAGDNGSPGYVIVWEYSA